MTAGHSIELKAATCEVESFFDTEGNNQKKGIFMVLKTVDIPMSI